MEQIIHYLVLIVNGVITFKNAPDFENPSDNDTNNVYLFEVTATDNMNNSQTQTISITVTDVDDTPPVFNAPVTATAPRKPNKCNKLICYR